MVAQSKIERLAQRVDEVAQQLGAGKRVSIRCGKATTYRKRSPGPTSHLGPWSRLSALGG